MKVTRTGSAAEAWVAELPAAALAPGEPTVVAFALFFTNFSTFLAKPGLYLEDLYVQPAHRGIGIGAALALSLGLALVQWVVLKMLPFDNKSEFQVIINMPEGTSLEETAATARALASPWACSSDSARCACPAPAR